ncbi:MAG: PQQ-dependent sugar dehydrogenase [Gemmatimonadaceae bacterium]|nr:PQQ-dependent sugar dehydrogenase [Gemmatimonadaceae bacterium]
MEHRTPVHRTLIVVTLFATVLLSFAACARVGDPLPSGGADASPQPKPREDVVRVETVAEGLEHPWGLAFLPDGRMLVTERPGRLRIVSPDGVLSRPLSGLLPIYAEGQGGLLDVAIAPDFERTREVFLSYAEPEGGLAGTAVMRGVLTDSTFEHARVIYRQRPKVKGGGHYGSRLVWMKDGTLFVTQGDRMNYRDRAQDLTQGMGKFVRIDREGRSPADNPFIGRGNAQPEIWSYGHRNGQAATIHPETGQLWTVEHGARGGDELNHPEAGKNYGWPEITYGRDYSGARIGDGVAREGMEQPVYYWDPVIAPSGMTFYTGDSIPGWKGSLLIGSLAGALVRLELREGRVVLEERYLGELRERIRDVVEGPDGFVYLLTDNPRGRILRVRAIRR